MLGINKPSYVPAECGMIPSELIQVAIRQTLLLFCKCPAGISAGTASVRTDVSGLIHSVRLNDRTAD